VGSEMCIRDRIIIALGGSPISREKHSGFASSFEKSERASISI